MTPEGFSPDAQPKAGEVPHSGIHHDEQPVHTFNTDLTSAVESGDLHNIETGNDGHPRLTLDTIADFDEPTKTEQTGAYTPLTGSVPATEQAPTTNTSRELPLTETLPTDPNLSEKKSGIGKRGIAAIAAGAVSSAILGGLGALHLFDGEKSAEAKTPSTSSVPEVPVNEPAPTTAEVVNPTENLEILHDSGTANEVLGDYANTISNIINARADGGNVETHNADLQYLTNLPAGTGAQNPSLEYFHAFVQHMSGNVVSARELYEKNGVDSVDIAFVSTFVSSEPTADGGFVVEALDEYWAIGEDGQSVGDIVSNTDPHRYTFSRADVTLPDGSVKNTFILTGFENGNADPATIS